MHCAESLRHLNESLDQRQSVLGDDLADHLAKCDSCRYQWQKLHACANLLREETFKPDDRFTDEVVEIATHARQLRRHQRAIIGLSFAATIAASVLVVAFALRNNVTNTDHLHTVPTFVHTHSQPGDANGLDETPDIWSGWRRVAGQLPAMQKLWAETWSSSQPNSPLTASVNSGLRPVAATMSSAIKVIGQRILPASRTRPQEEGQASGPSPSSTLV